MAKSKRIKIYNKGKRTWPLLDNGEKVECGPGRSVELDKSVADKLVEGYPKDFIHGETLGMTSAGGDVKKLKKQIKDLDKENADQALKIEELNDQIKDLQDEIEELKKTIED